MMPLTFCAVLTAATLVSQRIDVELDRSNDLSRYGTFTWSKDQKPVENLANHVRLVSAIQKKMMALGYRIDTRSPDLHIKYTVERHSAVQTRSTQQPSVWDPTDLKVQVAVAKEELVSIKLELKEADSGFRVWEATETYPLEGPDPSERQIKTAVEDLFSKFPKPAEDGAKKD